MAHNKSVESVKGHTVANYRAADKVNSECVTLFSYGFW